MLATITALYGSLTALLLVAVSFRVVKIRRAEGIGLGDSGNKELLHAMRVQANLAEYAPITLLLLLFLELNLLGRLWLHVFGIVFILARLIHLWGFGGATGYSFGRFFGTFLTFSNIIAMALTNAFLLLRMV